MDEARLHEVVEEQRAVAQALLEDVALVELSEGGAAVYIGRPLLDAPGTVPYLVRGLYRYLGTGHFSALHQGDQLLVHHGSLGSGRAPKRRRARVLHLERRPSQVYVYATTAK